MNKYAFNQGMPYCWLPPKILLIMKLIIVMMTTCLMQVTAATFAQKLTYSKKGASLEEIFKEIKKQTGYNVLYSPEKVDDTKKIDVYFKETALPEVLEKVVNGQALEYTINDKNISLKPKESTFLERLANRWASIDANGRVVDSENKPLPGASVKIKKTGKAVSTDKDGRFFLRGVEEGAILVISFIGYLPKEVSASANMGNVVLEQSLSKLDEVQVIAYGTTTQRLSTGNVTTIKADVIEKQPVNNPLLALQGRVPGLFIEQATGFAGTGVKVRIQGTNSIANGNDPLYVIDGIPFTSQLLSGGNSILDGVSGLGGVGGNPLNFINPADIESIDVLKDADATAIYGSRAANGAILITTKKGKSGDLRVIANLQNGWGNVSRKLDLLNNQQYLEMRHEALKNDGRTTFQVNEYDLKGTWDTTRYTDWQKELIGGTAQYTDLQTSISGGNNNTTFLVGAGYHKEGNVFPGDFDDVKSSVHFNLNSSSTNSKFKLQISGSFLQDDNTLPNTDLTRSAITLVPFAPTLYNQNGSINWQPDVSGSTTFFANPMGYLYQRFKNNTDNLIGTALLSYQIIPGLDIKGSFGYNKLQSKVIYTQPPIVPESILYGFRNTTFSNNSIKSWSVEPQLSYTRNISKGKLELLLGSTIQQENRDAVSINASGFSSDQVMEDISAATTLSAGYPDQRIYKYNAIFGRLNYNWDSKYVFNITARRDGSSRFGKENQFHNFGAFGAAWIFSEENIIKNNFRNLSFGKLRLSYGTTGSDQVGDYSFLGLYNPIYGITAPYQGASTYQPNGLTNPYLQWEETKKFQAGIDLGFLKDRILVNVNYLNNRSSNQLLAKQLPLVAGFSFIASNLPATVQNKGWELGLSTLNINSEDFKWSSSFNLTLPKNKLIAYPDFENSGQSSTYTIGQSINSQKIFHFLGVDPATGLYKFADRNGNPTSNPLPSYYPDNDAIAIINPDPEFYGGFQNTFTYKGFELDILFSFAKQIARNYLLGNNTPGFFNAGDNNLPISVLGRWQKPGDITEIQRYTAGFDLGQYESNARNSDLVWSDASYFRLKNASLSWQLPEKWLNTIRIRSLRLYLQGQNLLTFTNYLGLDPESKSSVSLPPLRVITFGLKMEL